MKTKKVVSLLMSIVMLLGVISMPATAEDIATKTFTLTIPYTDKNADNTNDFTAEFGTLANYYVYSYFEPAGKNHSLDKEILTYTVEDGRTYFYRVSNKFDTDIVTYGDYIKIEDNLTGKEVTLSDMKSGDPAFDKETVISDFSQNSYDTGDIYLNINEKGYLSLSQNETYTIYPLRNWLPIEGILNAKVIEPDFHIEVIPLEGENVISVEEDTTATPSRHSFKLTALNSGTAIVVVTYDAVIHNAAMGGPFLSANRKENAGVFVVSVDKENGIETNMKIHAGLNSTDKKLSGDYIDSEFDIFYYTGESGAQYSFLPEDGTKVSVLRPNMDAPKMTYLADNFEEVTPVDGVFTLTDLYEGSHIIKLEKDGKVEYQVIRAKKVSYTVYVDGAECSEPSPGDEVSIVFDKIYHPANKMSGVYNFTAAINYSLPDGATVSSTANQYNFATNLQSQTIKFTIPSDYSAEKFVLNNGAVITGMWGNAFGAHREITYEHGKSVNFTAVENVSRLCSLPQIDLSVAKSPEKTITVSAYAYTAQRDDDGVILDKYAVTVPADATAADCVKKAFAENNIPVEGLENGYVSSIDGLGAGQGYSGWCLAYNNDDYANYGLSSIDIKNGDELRFDYSMNVDTTTDDIGNGWYGNPVITAFALGDTSLEMIKRVTFDEPHNMNVSYTYNDFAKTPVEGKGTKENPYIINVEAENEVTYQDIQFTTTLNHHYLKSGQESTEDENTILMYVSSLGEKYKTWYKIHITVNKSQGGSISPSDQITVSFRLIGATKSTRDVDLSLGQAGYYGSKYNTWIKTTSYTLPSGSTAFDLIKKAADNAGILYNYENGYISAVTAPKIYGGYKLEEMANGANSGWMYTVNGKHPLSAADKKVLKNGDKVIFHYVNDYRYEQSDLVSGSSLGDGSLYDTWLDAADTLPPSNSSPGGGISSKPGNGTDDDKKDEIKDEEQNRDEQNQEKPEPTPQPPSFDEHTFNDVKKDDWYYASVQYVYENNLMEGTGEGFEPDSQMTRAMLVTVLYRFENPAQKASKSNFVDVQDGQWYADAIKWAAENGVVSGISQTEFAPDDNVTREQMAAIIYRYAKLKGYNTEKGSSLSQFQDLSEISDWALDAFKWASAGELIHGTSQTTVSPKDTATRAQVATILMRFCENIAK